MAAAIDSYHADLTTDKKPLRPMQQHTREAPMIPRRAVVCLGLSQLVCWSISYYLIGT